MFLEYINNYTEIFKYKMIFKIISRQIGEWVGGLITKILLRAKGVVRK